MKNLITFFLAIFVTSNLLAQATRSTHNAITATNITTLNLELDTEDIVVKETKGTRIIIESHITLETISNVTLLEFLIKSGRYDIENKVNAITQTLSISRKKANNVLLVKGEDCKESVRYVILIPSSVKFVNTNSSTASR